MSSSIKLPSPLRTPTLVLSVTRFPLLECMTVVVDQKAKYLGDTNYSSERTYINTKLSHLHHELNFCYFPCTCFSAQAFLYSQQSAYKFNLLQMCCLIISSPDY